MDEQIDVGMIKELAKQLASSDVMPDHCEGLAAPPVLTVDGVVLMGNAMMHPNSFKDVFGEDAYQELLKRPRVASPYSEST